MIKVHPEKKSEGLPSSVFDDLEDRTFLFIRLRKAFGPKKHFTVIFLFNMLMTNTASEKGKLQIKSKC